MLIETDGARASGHGANKLSVQDGQNNESSDRNEKQQIDSIEMAQPEQEPGKTERGQSKL